MNGLALRRVRVLSLILGLMACLMSESGSSAGWARSCFSVQLAMDTQSAFEHMIVSFGRRRISGGGYVTPDKQVCTGESRVEISWSIDGKKYSTKILDFKENMPKNFLDRPSNLMVLHVSEQGVPYIGYVTWLSELTPAKELLRPETPADISQRLADEALWTAVEHGDTAAAATALKQGAKLEQPWQSPTGARNELLLYSLLRNNVGLTCLLLEHGAEIQDLERVSRLGPVLKSRNASLVEVLLDYGAGAGNYRYAKEVGLPGRTEPLLYLAALSDQLEVVRLLRDFGADEGAKLSSGEQFRDWARVNASERIKAELARTPARRQATHSICRR